MSLPDRKTAFGWPAARVMPEGFLTCINLLDYRRRYALYKADRLPAELR
jgi:phosphodiesterase/alkaline phosphatase D-like protein